MLLVTKPEDFRSNNMMQLCMSHSAHFENVADLAFASQGFALTSNFHISSKSLNLLLIMTTFTNKSRSTKTNVYIPFDKK